VLVDTGAWLAVSDDRDDNYAAATTIQRLLATNRSRLYTSNFIVDEAYTLFLARLSHRLAVRFLDELRASTVTVVRVTEADEQQAEAILRRYADKRFSYTDATSFVIMERLGIEAAITFDRNFEQFGVRMLTP
jgi:predicted nucleic acid-binding protein